MVLVIVAVIVLIAKLVRGISRSFSSGRQQRCRRRQDLSVIDETEAQKYAASAADAAERLAGPGQCVFETTECAGAQIILRQPSDGQQVFDK